MQLYYLASIRFHVWASAQTGRSIDILYITNKRDYRRASFSKRRDKTVFVSDKLGVPGHLITLLTERGTKYLSTFNGPQIFMVQWQSALVNLEDIITHSKIQEAVFGDVKCLDSTA